ncbi:MAG TPA: DUF1552 domain-containing protein [Polyangiales bacterium]|nr:DUF1552 domain-containing protein [Polyangiales bacterium]
MKRHSTHRRSFLKAVGAGLCSLPFYRPLEHAFAQSMGESLPLKFIGVYQPHGICAEYYAMRPTDSETQFDLRYENCTLAAFDDPKTYGRSFKDQILVIEGLDLGSNVNGHDSAATILTGSAITAKKPQNISLDQFLAVERGLGVHTRVTSVALAVGDSELNSEFCISYGAGGEPLSKIIDPVKTFDQLFRGVVVGDDPAAIAEARRQQRLGKSLLDFVRADLGRLRGRLAPQEQQKLDQHLDGLRDVEKQLEAPSAASRQCGLPARPEALLKVTRDEGAAPQFDAITELQIELLARAIACDITRFGTLCLADLSFEGNPLGLPKDNHSDVAHAYRGTAIGSGLLKQGEPETWLPLAKLNAYLFGKTARLMQRLHELGVLDSTLIYTSGSMGDPSLHSPMNAPTVLAGGANGKFRMGRRLRLRDDCAKATMDFALPWSPACVDRGADDTRVFNNKLLVSIAQAFGVPIDSFGTQFDGGQTRGSLSELL